jgi:hypothetical protein
VAEQLRSLVASFSIYGGVWEIVCVVRRLCSGGLLRLVRSSSSSNGGGVGSSSKGQQNDNNINNLTSPALGAPGTRLDECRLVLEDVLKHSDAEGVPLLILANKQDREDCVEVVRIKEGLVKRVFEGVAS